VRLRCALIGVVGLLAACGNAAEPKAPARSYTLDEDSGSFRGIALGGAERKVLTRFGPDQGEPGGPVGPLGEHNYDNGPGTFASTPGRPRPDDRTKALRYRGMAFITNERRVYVIMSSLRGTRTAKGVRVGDRLGAARDAYRALRCATATDAHGGDDFPYCLARISGGRWLYFGGDPIGTVAIARVPLYGG
jgi:hypothetical protein